MSTADNQQYITWLHLSDLHLCEPKTGWDAHRVLDPLLIDLKKMEKDYGLLPQLLFFTGDAAFGNYGTGTSSTLAEQYQEVEQFFTVVRRAFSVEVLKENLFVVPGNHDVDRSEATESLTFWIENQTDPVKVDQLIKDGGKQWKQYIERLSIYREFLETNGYQHLLTDPDRLIYHVVREINQVKIGIGGFNSAWNCSRDNEKGKLWLGGNWQNGEIVKQLKKQQVELKLALIHHPPDWFVEQEAKVKIQMERDFDFFLHGHEHQGWINAQVDGHIRIAAAACYESSERENGYNFVRLNLENGEVEVWLRKFDGDGGGWIPRIIANKTNNDGLWLIKNQEKLKKLKNLPATNEDFNEKVRKQIQRILSTGKPAALALRDALLQSATTVSAPEEVLLPGQQSINPETVIREWRKIVEASLAQAREHISQIKEISSEILGWLILLCINADQMQKNGSSLIDFNTATEITIPLSTPTGIEVFVAKLQDRPAKFLLKSSDKALGVGHLDPADLEFGLQKSDALVEIKKLIYCEVFKKLPVLSENWMDRLANTVELNAEDKNIWCHLAISQHRYQELQHVVKDLKKDLPDLRLLIISPDNNGETAILVMDEARLESLILAFLTTLAEY